MLDYSRIKVVPRILIRPFLKGVFLFLQERKRKKEGRKERWNGGSEEGKRRREERKKKMFLHPIRIQLSSSSLPYDRLTGWLAG